MNTEQQTIQTQLQDDTQQVIARVEHLSDKLFWERKDGKWSVADVLQHLYLSTRPVARLMNGPREVLAQWGPAETPSRSYEEIADAYKRVLAGGVKAPDVVSPRSADMDVEKQTVVDRFAGAYQSTVDAINHWSEQELDSYRMPHPVLGLLTVREMLCFTSIHTRHHLDRLPTA